MAPKFTVISLADSEEDIIINKLIKKLPAKLYRSYLLKYLPIYRKDTSYLGMEANHLLLPFTKSQYQNLDSSYIDMFIKKLQDAYDLNYAYYEGDLSEYGVRDEESKTLIKYLTITDIVHEIRKAMKIAQKDMKLAIVDSDNRRIEYILELFAEDLNYLTIITSREEYFRSFKDMIYEDSGLVVDIIQAPLREPIGSNIIIDMNSSMDKGHIYYDKDAVIIDLESSHQKRQYMYARRRQYKVVYDVEVEVRSSVEDNQRLVAFLCSEYPILGNFLKDSRRSYQVSSILRVKNDFELSLKDVKYL